MKKQWLSFPNGCIAKGLGWLIVVLFALLLIKSLFGL